MGTAVNSYSVSLPTTKASSIYCCNNGYSICQRQKWESA